MSRCLIEIRFPVREKQQQLCLYNLSVILIQSTNTCLNNYQTTNSSRHHWKVSYIHDSLDQCPMPINADQNPGIDPNADQFRSMPDQFLSMSINVDQCQIKLIWLTVFTNVLLVPWSGIDRHWEELIGIDRQWSTLRGISDQCHDFDRHWEALGIDRTSPVYFYISQTNACLRFDPWGEQDFTLGNSSLR